MKEFFLIALPVFIAGMAIGLALPKEKAYPPNEIGLFFNLQDYKHDYMSSIPRENIEYDYNDDKELVVTFKNSKYYLIHTDEWTTNSMSPVFGSGNLMIIELHPKNISLYDFVAVYNDEFGASHQVIGYCDNGTGFITKGTNNKGADGYCWHESDIVYKYAGVIYTE